MAPISAAPPAPFASTMASTCRPSTSPTFAASSLAAAPTNPRPRPDPRADRPAAPPCGGPPRGQVRGRAPPRAMCPPPDGAPPTSGSDPDNYPDRPIWHRTPENVMRPDDSTSSPIPTAAPTTGTIPAGTNLTIRMIESVDSETNRVGQTFRASLEQPVMVDGQTAIPRGNDVIVKLVEAKESGKLTGRAELTLSLQSVLINGHFVEINTTNINKESGSQGEKTAKVAGGTAAVGAVIGAIAGGGRSE